MDSPSEPSEGDKKVLIILGDRKFIDASSVAAASLGHRSPYPYSPLEGKLAIRVLQLLPGNLDDPLSCNILHLNLEDDVRLHYEAVSYMWMEESDILNEDDHSEIRTQFIWCQNMTSVKISRNVHNLLKRLRHPSMARVLWLDQICINQDDKMEKACQIQIMQHVYSDALEVIFWLGEEDEHTHNAYKLLQALAGLMGNSALETAPWDAITKPDFTGALGLPTCPSPEWKSLARFFQRQVFRRIWIVQEVVLARQICGLCGSHSLQFSALAFAARTLAELSWAKVLVTYYGPECRPAFAASMFNFRYRFWNGINQSMPLLLCSTRRFRSTRPADKIYALLGLSRVQNGELQDAHGIPEALVPNECKSVVDVYRDATYHLIQSERSLDLLSSIEDRSLRKISDLPSWVPDYSVWQEVTILGMPCSPILYKAGGNGPVVVSWDQRSTLYVNACQVDKIAASGIVWEQNVGWDAQMRIWFEFFCNNINPEEMKSRFEDFGRTLIGNYALSTREYPAPRVYTLHLLASFAYALNVARDDGSPIPAIFSVDYASLGGDMSAYTSAMMYISPLRRFFISEHGRFGLAPRSANVGDEIVIMSGGRVPFVMRRSASGDGYEIMGECYLHCIMHGEALSLQDFEWQTLEIY